MSGISFVLGLVIGVTIFFTVAGVTALITRKKVLEQEAKEHQEIIEVVSNEQTEETKED